MNILRLFASGLSALLYILSFPSNPYPLLVWVCLVPWLLALENSNRINAFINSCLMAILAYHVYLWTPFYTSTSEITTSDGLAALLTFVFLFLYVLPFILFGIIYPWFRNNSVLNRIYLSSLLTIFAVLIPNLFTHNLGFHLYDNPLFIQVTDISGVSLLFWLIIFVNLSISHLINKLWQNRQNFKALPKQFYLSGLWLAFAISFVLGYGFYQLTTNNSTQTDTMRAASVQANLGDKLSPLSIVRDSKKGHAISYIEMTRELLKNNSEVDLIVWPENGMSVDCNNSYINNKISALVKEVQIPLMYQCLDCSKTDSTQCYNQSRYLNANGNLNGQYNKQNLFPLVEYIPQQFSIGLIKNNLKYSANFEIGNDINLFKNPKVNIIPSICFDAHSVELISKSLDLGGNLLVIQSNNRIFKDSFIGLFDLSINVLNSISLRMPTVKVNNSGFGAFILETGEIIDGSITPVYQKASSVHTLNINRRFSLFQSIGDWFIYLSGIISIIGLYRTYRQRLKSKNS